MAYNYEKYINKIFAFDFYDGSFFALCVAADDGGKLICYRVRHKEQPKFSDEVLVEDSAGNGIGYVVQYSCKFRIHPGCMRNKICVCEPEFVRKINQMYSSLRPLKELNGEEKALRDQYYETADRKERKAILKKREEILREIDSRKAMFLQMAKKKKVQSDERRDKYRNYRKIPNREGISRMYNGGGCSSR